MKISIFGTGYVGCVSAACFAEAGHTVIGVDINPVKVEIINSGRSPIVESGISDLITNVVRSRNLSATTDSAKAVMDSDLSLVCVGTPSNRNGSLDLTHVRQVCQEIGAALKSKDTRHTVVMRSTMLPGTIETMVRPAIEEYSGKKAGKDFGIGINPEFLREGTSLRDFHGPPFTLIGADDDETAGIVRELYANIHAPVFITSIKTAEMVKYVCNCFHALKIGFANEIGNICKALDVDSLEVMNIFCQDTKLNLSSYYLTPGFAFGGSCLPKDLRALTYKAKELDIQVPVLSAILPSNLLQIERATEMVLRTEKKKVGVLGLSFKAGTDDLRESPMVALIETLIGKGLQLTIYDKDVALGRLFGANKEYIERQIPHIAQLMRDNIQDIFDHSELIIIGKKAEEFRQVETEPKGNQQILDLVHLFDSRRSDENYQGICW